MSHNEDPTSSGDVEQDENSPNGIPYLDFAESKIGVWESGEFYIRFVREDGESIRANLTESQFDALEEGTTAVRKEAENSEGVDLND
jgi:hypothetical protein